jgi:MFS transporter, DHA2 family, multidrug resistance protein
MLFTLIIQGEYINPKVRRFDIAGFISVTIFLPLTLYTLSQGNAATNSQGWHAPYILACSAISIIAFAVFITAELTVKEPLLDLRLLLNHNFGIANIILVIFSLGMFGSTFLLPVYLQNSLGYSALQSGRVFLPVGIIQGIMAPITGKISDKTNPKIPLIIGVLLFSLSFYLNSQLSWLTEHSFIMLTLYLRGFAMGLMFTALTTVSMYEIPREKMAQASAITNSIRQLGGSLGVAILATLLTTRVTYHSQVFSESIKPGQEAYQQTIGRMRHHIVYEAGAAPSNAQRIGQTLLLSNMGKQAYIEGINDDFLIAGLITFTGIIPIFFLHSKKQKSTKENFVSHE